MTKPQNPAHYRPDIDGLRSIAVLSVILYHLEFPGFTGGFIGVDVFFVISGYLITRLIVTEIEETGSFRFGRFYMRRIRRLFPAMFVTLLVCAVLAILLFSPEHLQRFAGASISAIFSLSNFYFWSEAGYFDSEAVVKPLLHTWSLSVEEQFYLIWPATLLLVMLIARRAVLPVLVILGILSLYMNYAFYDGEISAINLPGFIDRRIEDGASTVFFLMPFRIFEFVIGGAVVWTERRWIGAPQVRTALFALGIALIVVPVFVYTHDTPFPLHNALAPCLGTAFIIQARNPLGIGRLVDNPVAVWIGLVSYSAYLVHWPLFVFYSYWKFDPLTLPEKLGLLAATMVLAGVMYRWIEQPFRKLDSQLYARVSGRRVTLAMGAVVSVVVAASVHAYSFGGWQGRLPKADVPVALQMRFEGRPISAELAPPEGAQGRFNEMGPPLAEGRPRVLLIGDSHADRLRWFAQRIGLDHDMTVIQWSLASCPPVFGTYKFFPNPRGAYRQEPCKDTIEAWEAYATDPAHKFDYVILASRWSRMLEGSEYGAYDIPEQFLVDRSLSDPDINLETSREAFSKYLRRTVTMLQEAGSKPIIVSQVPNHGKRFDGCMIPTFIVPEQMAAARCTGITQDFVRSRMAWVDAEIRAIGAETGASVLIPTDIFCDPQEPHCKSTSDGVLLSDDGSHVNRFGSLYLAQGWSEQDDFPFSAPVTPRP